MGMIYLLLAAELLEKSYKSYLLGFLASKFIRLSEIHYHRSLLRQSVKTLNEINKISAR